MLIVGDAMHTWGTESIREISAPSSHLFCKRKTAPKNKSLKKKKINSGRALLDDSSATYDFY